MIHICGIIWTENFITIIFTLRSVGLSVSFNIVSRVDDSCGVGYSDSYLVIHEDDCDELDGVMVLFKGRKVRRDVGIEV